MKLILFCTCLLLLSFGNSFGQSKSEVYSYHIDYFHLNNSLGYGVSGFVVDPVTTIVSNRREKGLSGIKSFDSYYKSDTIFVDLIWNNCDDSTSLVLLGFENYDTSTTSILLLPDKPFVTRLMILTENCGNSAQTSSLNGIVDTISYGTTNTYFAANDLGSIAKVKVYPNPSYGLLNIEETQPNSMIRILQLDGKEVFKQVANNPYVNTRTINISGVQKGIYILELVQVNGLIRHSLITKQ